MGFHVKGASAVAWLLLLAASPDLRAQLIIPGNTTATFLGTVPEKPIAGQPYLVRASFGPCEVISTDPNDALVLDATANSLTIQVPGVFSDNCSVMLRETLYSLPPIGQAGTYAVALQMIDGGDIGRLGTRLVTVVAPGDVPGSGGTVTIPVSTPLTWVALALSLLASAALRRAR
jgi:hypothetical protein